MFERILVPLDGSPRAEVILSQVARILQREDSEVLLLRVVDVPSQIGRVNMAPVRAAHVEEAQKYIQDLTRRFQDKGARVNGRVVEGYPPDAILETARAQGSTLIAMSTHGRSGLARWTLGSVAEKLARVSPVPLLLVRSFRRTPQGELEPHPPQALPFARILVAVDGTPASESVLGPAQKVAQLYGSSVLVLHVAPPVVPPSPILPGMEAALPMMMPPPPSSADDEITAKAAMRFTQAGLEASRLTTVGEPASEILDLSKNRDVDLIALGTHGRSGLQRWALGSVAERVLRSAEVPLLLVRVPEK
jgi:nucleotide-binding universal stress UspA family protein